MFTGSEQIILCLAVFVVALLYSSVGHGGASGYLAVLSLLSVPRETAVLSALLLNILVSALAFAAFKRAGHFQWKLVLPFVLGSAPAATIGGALKISPSIYSILLAVSLCLAAFRISYGAHFENRLQIIRQPSIITAISIGLLVGLISGMIGIGGGVFLSPILMLAGWANAKQTAAASASFILVNSVAGLMGQMHRGIDVGTPIWIPLVFFGFAGGWIGSRMGASYFSNAAIRRTLSFVLWIAGFKLI